MRNALPAFLISVAFLGCSSNERPSHPPRPEAELMSDMGELHPSAKAVQANEDVAIAEKDGLQSRREGKFAHVVQGRHGDKATKYLWTIDDRGVNCALEQTPMASARGHITHTNISLLARFAGEAWFTGSDRVTINGHSGRFGDRASATPAQYEAALEMWERLGYKVTAIPLGQR